MVRRLREINGLSMSGQEAYMIVIDGTNQMVSLRLDRFSRGSVAADAIEREVPIWV